MKCILDDGTSIYKLTDFGAARELEEGEQFESIYGTQEYLHPDVYERAFLITKPTTFVGTIDLWSLGVTLYHVATAALPFVPYGGRLNRDKKAMYKITSMKESGVISGIQKKQNGVVDYQKNLPKDCLLSDNLKEVITPLLAGLMEFQLSKTWSFNEFFTEVETILSRKVVHIFHVNQVHLITLFISLNETCTAFQNHIMEKTGIESVDQILLFQNQILNIQKISDLPVTMPETPLFLFDSRNNNIAICEENQYLRPSFPANSSVDIDASQAKVFCIVGYRQKREIEKYSLYSQLIYEAVDNLSRYLSFEFQKLYQNAKYLEEKAMILNVTSELVTTTQFENELNAFMTSCLANINALQQDNFQQTSLKTCWEKQTGTIDNTQIISSASKAATYVDSLSKSYEQFLKNKKIRILSRNEQKLHNLEKVKISHLLFKMHNVLKEAYSLYKTVALNLEDWYKTAQSTHIKLDILKSDVAIFEVKLVKYQEDLKLISHDVSQEQTSSKTVGSLIENLQQILKKHDDRKNYFELIDEHYILSHMLANYMDEMERCILDFGS